MLLEDQKAFLRAVHECDVVVTTRDSDSVNVEPAGNQSIHLDKTLCFWNRTLLPKLEREWIPDPGYYRIDTLYKPILEFTPSFVATWEGKPALGQGRLFGNFESHLGKPQNFEKWYRSLAHWIRTNFKRNPRGTSGYIGPAALEFYRNGGYLLPNFLPPTTKEWLTEIGEQHIHQSLPLRSAEPKKPCS